MKQNKKIFSTTCDKGKAVIKYKLWAEEKSNITQIMINVSMSDCPAICCKKVMEHK